MISPGGLSKAFSHLVVLQTPLCYNHSMVTITIPKTLSQRGDLVVIPKKEFDALVARADITDSDVLRWSREAKRLHRQKKLPTLRSLKEL